MKIILMQVVLFSSSCWLSAQAHTLPPGTAKQRVLQPPLLTRQALSPAIRKKEKQSGLKNKELEEHAAKGEYCEHEENCLYLANTQLRPRLFSTRRAALTRSNLATALSNILKEHGKILQIQ